MIVFGIAVAVLPIISVTPSCGHCCPVSGARPQVLFRLGWWGGEGSDVGRLTKVTHQVAILARFAAALCGICAAHKTLFLISEVVDGFRQGDEAEQPLQAKRLAIGVVDPVATGPLLVVVFIDFFGLLGDKVELDLADSFLIACRHGQPGAFICADRDGADISIPAQDLDVIHLLAEEHRHERVRLVVDVVNPNVFSGQLTTRPDAEDFAHFGAGQ
ncbi:hypothetical protein KUV57_20170 [Epibacterium sp. DP7N7-1]|nr:hypothetical protein [Epibacterium sp. DP7N7-1]